MAFGIGEICTGVVTDIAKFGVFVKLETGEIGLVHISEISDGFVSDLRQLFKRGDSITVKVLSLDEQSKKIYLSYKQANQPVVQEANQVRKPAKPYKKPVKVEEVELSEKDMFEKKLQKFLQDSGNSIKQLNKRTEKKQGTRRIRKNNNKKD